MRGLDTDGPGVSAWAWTGCIPVDPSEKTSKKMTKRTAMQASILFGRAGMIISSYQWGWEMMKGILTLWYKQV